MVALVIALAWASTASAAVAYVQSKFTEVDGVTGSTTIAATFTSTVGSGNAVCGAVTYETAGTISGIADDKSNAYTVQRTTAGISTTKQSSFYLANITNAPQTITVTFSGSVIFRALVIAEASGVATASALHVETGQAQAAPGTGAGAVTSGAVTTTAAGGFACGFASGSSAFFGGTLYTAGTGYTEREETGGGVTGIDLMLETQVLGAAGSEAATFTSASGNDSIAQILVLKQATATSACVIGGGIIRAGCPN